MSSPPSPPYVYPFPFSFPPLRHLHNTTFLQPKTSAREVPLYGAILLPPLAIAVTDPDIFFAALDTAGTFGISLLCGVLPAAMAWSQRYRDAERSKNRSTQISANLSENVSEVDELGELSLATLPLVPGGKATLAGMRACGLCSL